MLVMRGILEWWFIRQHAFAIWCLSTNFYKTVTSTWTVYVKVGVKKHSQHESIAVFTKQVKNLHFRLLFIPLMNNVSSSIIHIKEQVSCHWEHPSARFQIAACTFYLVGMKTRVWHSSVYLNGIIRHEDAFSSWVCSDSYQASSTNIQFRLLFIPLMNWVSSTILQITSKLTRRPVHPALRVQPAASTSYLVSIKTQVWYIFVDMIGIYKSWRRNNSSEISCRRITKVTKVLWEHGDHYGNTRLRVHTATCMCYLVSTNKRLWQSCVDLNGICKSRRKETFATQVIRGPYQASLKKCTHHLLFLPIMNNTSSSITQIKGTLTCRSGHTAARFQMAAYTCYLMDIKTLVWYSYVNLNGIC